jgi:hypothetical protein
MTDISNWPELIRKEGNYMVVPLNEYQMGNLIDALAQVPDTGDWWSEIQDIVAVAMKYGCIDEVRSNTGKIYTREQILDRAIR